MSNWSSLEETRASKRKMCMSERRENEIENEKEHTHTLCLFLFVARTFVGFVPHAEANSHSRRDNHVHQQNEVNHLE